MEDAASDTSQGDRLESWKQIATYLKRDIRTVQRWEKREGLPVHRHLHAKGVTVYAYPAELDGWWGRRRPNLEQRENAPARRAWLGWAAAGAGTLAAVAAVAGWLLTARPAAPWIATRQVWTGPDVDRLGGVSPDGRLLSFADHDTLDLAVVDLATGRQRRLTRKPPKARVGGAHTPLFSPDGKRIAFGWDLGAVSEVRIVGVDGTGEQVIFRGGKVPALVDWSPDGRRLMMVVVLRDGTYQIAWLEIAGGRVEVLKQFDWREPRRARLSPDGRYVAYDLPPDRFSANRDVYLFPVADPGAEAAAVAHSDDDLVLEWTVTGDLLYSCNRTGTSDGWLLPLTEGRPGQAVLAVKDLGVVWPLNFTRNGSFYYGRRTALTDVLVARMDPASGTVVSPPQPATERYLGANVSPDWSPDGRRLAYVPRLSWTSRWPAGKIVVRELASGKERELNCEVASIDMIRWSPDGRSLLAAGGDRRNRSGVFRIDAHSGAVRAIAGSEEALTYHEPMWARDGKHVFYKVRQGMTEPSRLMVRNLETGLEREFLPSVYRIAPSPDGKRLAYCTFDDQREYLRIVPLSGGAGLEVYSAPRLGRILSVAWAPGGHHLLFARKDKLWRIPADGGEPEQAGLEIEALRELRVHPDGTSIAFTAGSTSRSEVWALENLLARR